MTSEFNDFPAESERPSKTQRKKAMHALQDLGEVLCEMPLSRLETIEMPERLMEAIKEFKRTKSHEGRRRQMQFIGKVLRSVDEEPIREAVAAFELGTAKDALDLHEAEAWRARFLADDATATEWMKNYPDSDLTHLRTLIRNARKDAAQAPEQRNGRAFRELFQYIKQALQQAKKTINEDDESI